ncbi:hypothetical protein H8E77_24165 [bacterium]|nr:hypothetical protein [bacterium]
MITGFAEAIGASPADDGSDLLTLTFTHFDPGETFIFKVDVDDGGIVMV